MRLADAFIEPLRTVDQIQTDQCHTCPRYNLGHRSASQAEAAESADTEDQYDSGNDGDDIAGTGNQHRGLGIAESLEGSRIQTDQRLQRHEDKHQLEDNHTAVQQHRILGHDGQQRSGEDPGNDGHDDRRRHDRFIGLVLQPSAPFNVALSVGFGRQNHQTDTHAPEQRKVDIGYSG